MKDRIKVGMLVIALVLSALAFGIAVGTNMRMDSVDSRLSRLESKE